MSKALTAPPPHVPPERIVDFDVYAPENVTDGFHAAWKRLHAPGVPEIVWTPRNGGHWVATRGRIINALFADHERFSNRVIVVPKEIGELHKMIPTTIDPPEHRPYRNLLNAGMAPKAIMRMEPVIQRLAAELTEAVRPLGACNFTTAYAERFPIEIFMTLVGLPIEDAPMMKRWADAIVRPTPELGFEQATRNFEGYFGDFVDRRAAAPGDDMLSQMIAGEVAGRPMTRHESVQLCSQILIAGLDTVVNFLGFAMLFLARDPDVAGQKVGTRIRTARSCSSAELMSRLCGRPQPDWAYFLIVLVARMRPQMAINARPPAIAWPMAGPASTGMLMPAALAIEIAAEAPAEVMVRDESGPFSDGVSMA